MRRIEIRAYENGPYVIAGSASYRDSSGELRTSAGAEVALCRCGRSRTSPLCDGSHKSVGFEASQTLVELQTD